MRAVALVHQLFDFGAFQKTCTFFDGAINGVVWTLVFLRDLDRQAQAGVHCRIRATHFGGDLNLARKLGENSALFLSVGSFDRAFPAFSHGILQDRK